MQERREIILGPRGTTSRRADAVLPTDVLGELLELDAWVAEDRRAAERRRQHEAQEARLDTLALT